MGKRRNSSGKPEGVEIAETAVAGPGFIKQERQIELKRTSIKLVVGTQAGIGRNSGQNRQ
jgi:hypothetical protein